jgi:hypothetical protein
MDNNTPQIPDPAATAPAGTSRVLTVDPAVERNTSNAITAAEQDRDRVHALLKSALEKAGMRAAVLASPPWSHPSWVSVEAWVRDAKSPEVTIRTRLTVEIHPREYHPTPREYAIKLDQVERDRSARIDGVLAFDELQAERVVALLARGGGNLSAGDLLLRRKREAWWQIWRDSNQPARFRSHPFNVAGILLLVIGAVMVAESQSPATSDDEAFYPSADMAPAAASSFDEDPAVMAAAAAYEAAQSREEADAALAAYQEAWAAAEQRYAEEQGTAPATTTIDEDPAVIAAEAAFYAAQTDEETAAAWAAYEEARAAAQQRLDEQSSAAQAMTEEAPVDEDAGGDSSGTVQLAGIAALAAGVVLLFLAWRQRRYVLTTGRPLQDPRNLARLDSWQTVVFGLGDAADRLRESFDRELAKVGGEMRAAPEHIWYWGVDGVEERQQLVVRFRSAVAFVHIKSYQDNLYVAWDAHVNRGTWLEKPVASGYDRITRRPCVVMGLTAGTRQINEYDIADANLLIETVHAAITRPLRLAMEERKIDQEIDFKVVRESRRVEQAAQQPAGGLMSRLRRTA